MDEYVVTKKEELTTIADAVRSMTGISRTFNVNELSTVTAEATAAVSDKLDLVLGEIEKINRDSIIEEVIAALGTPVFGRVDDDKNIILTGELADGTYTLKYEDAEGNVTEIGTLVQNADAPNYTNQIPISTDTDGKVFNGTGYQIAKRISGSTGTLADITNPNAATPAFATGFIPVKNGDIIRLENCWMDTASLDDSNSPYGHRTWALNIIFYDSGKSRLVSDAWASDNGHMYITPVIEADGKIHEFTVKYSGAAFMRINLAANNPAEAILTVNEEIV